MIEAFHFLCINFELNFGRTLPIDRSINVNKNEKLYKKNSRSRPLWVGWPVIELNGQFIANPVTNSVPDIISGEKEKSPNNLSSYCIMHIPIHHLAINLERETITLISDLVILVWPDRPACRLSWSPLLGNCRIQIVGKFDRAAWSRKRQK